MPEVHVGTVGEVPTYWVDLGRETLSAVMLFRCGMVDETLLTRGWLHLLEHLALHGRDAESGALHVNGSVGLLYTQFEVHGPRDQVVRALGHIAAWLRDPTLDRANREADVLRAESALRGTGQIGQALLWRYGPQGPGLAGYDEFGLHAVRSEPLRELVSRVFTTGNAALVLDGPPPPDLELALPAGARLHMPRATSLAQDLPLGYVISGGVTMSGNLPRSNAAILMPMILRERVNRVLRVEGAGAYAPWAHYEPVDADRAIAVVGSDISETLRPSVVTQLLGVLDALATGAEVAESLDRARDGYLQAMRDPFNAAGMGFRAAREHLQGKTPTLTLSDNCAGIEAVTAGDIQDLSLQVLRTLMLGVEGKVQWDDQVIPMGRFPTRPMGKGRRYRSASYPAETGRLLIGTNALAMGDPSDAMTIDIDQIAAVVASGDGGRQVVDANGWILNIEPTLWRRGQQAIQNLDERIPSNKVVRLPSRASVPKPLSPWELVRASARKLRSTLAILGGVALVAIALAVYLATPAGTRSPSGGAALVTGTVIWLIIRTRGPLRRRPIIEVLDDKAGDVV